MKHIIDYKLFESTENPWGDITQCYDVGQLIELIEFKYGKVIPESAKEFAEDEGDYNPDEIYDTIHFELTEIGKLDDFLQNYQSYSIEKDENDPFHWRHRQKEQEKFNKKLWDRSEAVSDTTIEDILLDLSDMGFKSNILWSPPRNNVTVTITKSKHFKYSDIEDTIKRLSGYMESEGFTTDQRFVNVEINKININYKFSSLNLLKSKSKYKI